MALLLGLIVLMAGGAFAGVRYYSYCANAGTSHTPLRLTVSEGESGGQVVEQLADAGVVRCGGLIGRFLLQRNGRGNEIRAGTYQLTTNMGLNQAIDLLTTPPKEAPTVNLAIPEGFRLTQIAQRAQQDLGVSAATFMRFALSGHVSLPPYLPAGKSSAEGFLFPATYQFLRDGVTPNTVIQKMLDAFASEAQALGLKQGAARLGLSPYQVVIVASMIEREARVERDRPLIAAVIYNRLKRHMTLGIDATLLYDDPTPDGQLSNSDIHTPTPYNTRLNPGLPPTPIASPGAASLAAALHPAKVDYLYYVLCGPDGHHVFNTTYAGFLRDKARCLG